MTTTLAGDIAHPFERVRTWHVTDDEFCIGKPVGRDGIEAALGLARAAAGDKDVGIRGGANIMRQYLKAGSLDEMQIHLVSPSSSAAASGSSRISSPGGSN